MTSVADILPEDESARAASDAAGATSKAVARSGAAASDSDAAAEPAPSGIGGAARTLIAAPASADTDLRAERDGAARKPRPLAARLLDYSAHAAMIVGLIGFAWTVSNHVSSAPAPVGAPVGAAAVPASPEPAAKAMADAAAGQAADKATDKATDRAGDAAAELIELRRANERLAADVGGLRAQVEALASNNSRVPGQVKGLQITMEALQNGLGAARSETAASMAQIGSRLDRLARERAAAPGRPSEENSDASTGSLPPKDALARPPVTDAAPLPPARADAARPEAGRTADAAKVDAGVSKGEPGKGEDGRRDGDRPPILAAYVVRDVTDGVALIEGRRGMLEVVPGVSIPGAGVVKTIERCKSVERCGRGWTVITTKGQLASGAPLPVARREGRRDYRYSYRYDF